MSTRPILTITRSREDATTLLSALALDGWKSQWVSNCQDALAYLDWQTPGLVLCESRLRDGSWKTVVDALEVIKSAQLLMVFPSGADRALETDVLNLDGYQVQVKPFDPVELEDVIRTAILHAEVPVTGI